MVVSGWVSDGLAGGVSVDSLPDREVLRRQHAAVAHAVVVEVEHLAAEPADDAREPERHERHDARALPQRDERTEQARPAEAEHPQRPHWSWRAHAPEAQPLTQ